VFLDEDEVGTGNVEMVVCSPKTFNLFGRGFVSDGCKKEHIAGYGYGQQMITIWSKIESSRDKVVSSKTIWLWTADSWTAWKKGDLAYL
jgi:hypothetical protein